MKMKALFSALAVAGLLTVSQSALAGTITTSYLGSANFGSGQVGYTSGTITPSPNGGSAGVLIGGDTMSVTASTDSSFPLGTQLNTWCVDIYHWAANISTYNVSTGTALATELSSLRPGTPTGTDRVTALGKLANEVYSTVDTKDESAAFQLAVWTITYGAYEGGKFVVDTTNPGFRVDSGTQNSAAGVLANQWLTNLNTATNTGNYQMTYLSDAANEHTQDMVVFANVPEPASLALLGLGLAGLGFARRRKSKAT